MAMIASLHVPQLGVCDYHISDLALYKQQLFTVVLTASLITQRYLGLMIFAKKKKIYINLS
jgi:hypothetical protein